MKKGQKTNAVGKTPPKLKAGIAKQLVLDLYASGDFTIEAACLQAGHTRSVHASWLKRDAEYAKDFEEARKWRSEVLEDEAYRRAKVGTERPVYYCGKKCGSVQEYSDTLLIFLLKAANPAKYRDNYKQAEADRGQTVDEMLREMAASHGFTDDESSSN